MSDHPTATPPVGASVKINIPAGWYAYISGVSRQTYNQMIRLRVTEDGNTNTEQFVSQWGQANDTMRLRRTREGSYAISGSKEPKSLEFQFLFSKDQKVSGLALEKAKAFSSKLRLMRVETPKHLHGLFPDYVTFYLFAQDKPDASQTPGAVAFDDAIGIVNVIKRSTKSKEEGGGSTEEGNTEEGNTEEGGIDVGSPSLTGRWIDPDLDFLPDATPLHTYGTNPDPGWFWLGQSFNSRRALIVKERVAGALGKIKEATLESYYPRTKSLGGGYNIVCNFEAEDPSKYTVLSSYYNTGVKLAIPNINSGELATLRAVRTNLLVKGTLGSPPVDDGKKWLPPAVTHRVMPSGSADQALQADFFKVVRQVPGSAAPEVYLLKASSVKIVP